MWKIRTMSIFLLFWLIWWLFSLAWRVQFIIKRSLNVAQRNKWTIINLLCIISIVSPNLTDKLLFSCLHWTLDPKYTTHPDICTWVPLYTELHCRLRPLRHTSAQRNYNCKIYWHIISKEVWLQVSFMIYYEIYSRSHRIRIFWRS